jgi:NTE family protein
MNKKTIGLALGGGSARGLAHIGVISVLEKYNIPIDLISGCSMGAIIGGIYASGCEIEYLSKFIQAVDEKKLFDYTIPSRGYVKGNKIQQLIRLLTRDYSFGQTKIPFACIAVDVEAGKLVTFKKGPLHEAIRASISIPGVFIPHEIGEKVYVDGGVLDRIAIDAAREIGADFVIASDVGYRGEGLSKPRGLIQVLENTFTLASWELTKEQMKRGDVVIEVNVSDFDPNTMKDAEKIIERGVIAAEKYIPEIKKKLVESGRLKAENFVKK